MCFKQTAQEPQIIGHKKGKRSKYIKSTQMGPLLAPVCPCFRENVIVTCKIVSFLCSLDNFLLKNVIIFFLEIKFQNGVHLKKGLFLTYFSHFLVNREKTQNSFSTYLTYIHNFSPCSLTFFALPILPKLFGLSFV